MHAQLVIVEGKDQGKNVPLVKAETIIDNPGKNPARIYRGPDGYVIHAQLGPGEPRVNGKPVPGVRLEPDALQDRLPRQPGTSVIGAAFPLLRRQSR